MKFPSFFSNKEKDGLLCGVFYTTGTGAPGHFFPIFPMSSERECERERKCMCLPRSPLEAAPTLLLKGQVQ